MGIRIEKPTVLFVEGKDDEGFFIKFLETIDYTDKIQVLSYNGKDKLQDFLNEAIKLHITKIKSLGLIRDANKNIKGSIDSIRAALRNAGFDNIPSEHGKITKGSIYIKGANKPININLGFYLMPNGKDEGELEDLLLRITKKAHILECVDIYMECLKEKDINIIKQSKAKIYAYISAQEEPGLKIGEAARAGYWDIESELLAPLKNFIKNLPNESI